jgi:predicted  nucleic acid-binding Zn-ribbon protein
MSEQIEQLRGLSASNSDWQTRAEEAERLVAELKSGLAHAQGDLFAAQLRVAALETEAEKAAAELQWLRGVVETHEETLSRVREVAERQAVLDVSNGSWKAAARDVAGKILRALEGK